MQELYLVDLINAYLNKTALPEVNDWGELFNYAKSNSLGALFYEAIKDSDNVPVDIKERALKHYLVQVSQLAGQEYYANLIFEIFRDKGIKYMPMKGWYLRQYYPMPELRSSCDVDFFYDVKDKKLVNQILIEQGFENAKDGINHGEWQKGIVTIENHHSLVRKTDIFAKYYDNVWDRLKTEDNILYNFTNEDFYVYFLVHSAKHFVTSGFGVRTVLDIYLYLKNVELDKKYVTNELKKIKLLQFASVLERLSNVWFNGDNHDKETIVFEQYIFQSGTFGTFTNNAVIKGASDCSDAKTARKRYMLKTIFPPYNRLKTLYPVLEKVPVLLPFIWVYKWFVVLFKRPKRIKGAFTNANEIDKNNIQFIKEVMEIANIPKK